MIRSITAVTVSLAVLATAACSTPQVAAPPAVGPLVHPLPDPVQSGLGLTLQELVTIPPSKPNPPPTPGDNLDRWARINYLGEVPDGSGRLFVPDLNGKMYFIKDGKPQTYLDLGAEFAANFLNTKSLSSGFVSAAFDPEYGKNGIFYTVHTEEGPALNPKVPQTNVPDLRYPQNTPAHGVLTEWKAADPSADTFRGTRREVLRIGFFDTIHGIQQIGFNPTARAGDKDYGLLYIAVGDGGVVGEESPGMVTTVPQDLRVPQGKVLRIDPRGTNGANGQYGIPASNPFVGKPGAALREIYASGLRDPVRFSWDAGEGHRMFLSNIGEQQIESVYEVRPGDNFGWSQREGPLVFKAGDPSCGVFPLPADDSKYGYSYPVVAFAHNPPPGQPPCRTSGHAIVGGFVYWGSSVPELRGKYVFADFVPGRIFYADTKEMHSGAGLAKTYELAVFTDTGQPITMQQLAGSSRVDLRFGADSHGELYVLSKANGKVWKVTGMRRTSAPPR
ncbi:MAG TPA: PQQ-dependent sugar dehydrogenase [Mycobacterium sp.]|nr:PQQ-dependent sugar dehydrogenase [Mycobacterium sp.]